MPVITSVKITVEYAVKTWAGIPVAAGDFDTNPPLPPLSDQVTTHPLNVDFLLRPPIGEDIERTPPNDYVIEVNLTVDVDGQKVSTTTPPLGPLKVPVSIPAIGIPSVLVLATHPVGNPLFPGDALCMVRAASPLRGVDKVIETLNTVADTLAKVRVVMGLANANPVADIELILNVLRNAPVVFFAVGPAPDLNEFGGWDWIGYGGFDDTASCAFMLGVTGTQARVWSSEDFSDSDWHEHSTFTVPDLGIDLGVPAVGFGVYRNDSFGDWDTDPGDSMHDEIESVRFLP